MPAHMWPRLEACNTYGKLLFIHSRPKISDKHSVLAFLPRAPIIDTRALPWIDCAITPLIDCSPSMLFVVVVNALSLHSEFRSTFKEKSIGYGFSVCSVVECVDACAVSYEIPTNLIASTINGWTCMHK